MFPAVIWWGVAAKLGKVAGGGCEMTKQKLVRLLIAGAIACGVHEASAQLLPMPRPGPASPGSPANPSSVPIYAITGAIGAIGVLGIWNQSQIVGCCGNQPSASPEPSPPPPGSYSPDAAPTTLTQQPNVQTSPTPGGGGGGGPGGATPRTSPTPGGGGGGGGGGGTGRGSPGAARPTVQALRGSCNLPPVGETRFVPTEVIFDIPSSVSAQVLDDIAARHAMTRVETTGLRLTGRTLHRWRIDGGISVADMIRNVCTDPSDRQVAGAQPNYLYALAQDQDEPVNNLQYVPEKLKLLDAHRLARGNKVLVAIIDSEVDASHPDLAGAVTASFEAAAVNEIPHSHGTGMAGAIAAHRTMLGTAPRVGLLTVRAFSSTAGGAQGTTFNILKGLDWAADEGARVVNMSFAGPSDPLLRDALLKANKKGMVLIAAAGNAGPSSPPEFPGAYPSVIAITATDVRDALYPGANRGNYIAVAAPGVDVLVPAPDSTYQLTTGTSVAAAEVSGVAALLIERNPALTTAQVRKILMDTATHLGPKSRGRDFGAGLVNALDAVKAAKPKSRSSPEG
jgi:Subtilase family